VLDYLPAVEAAAPGLNLANTYLDQWSHSIETTSVYVILVLVQAYLPIISSARRRASVSVILP
jgi:hypothetical protein